MKFLIISQIQDKFGDELASMSIHFQMMLMSNQNNVIMSPSRSFTVVWE